MEWNHKFDKFFEAHEKIKKMGGRLTVFKLDLPENESIEDYNKEMDAVTKSCEDDLST